jgi:hypothetical protein
MNIIEAIKSGKNFRRKSWPAADYMNANVDRFDLHLEELLANDWEIEEPSIPITRTQLIKACHNQLANGCPPWQLAHSVAEELGL